MKRLVTTEPTDYPIGRSGFYLTSNHIEGYRVSDIKKITKTLWGIRLCGLGNFRSDETGSEASTVWERAVFHTVSKKIYFGCYEKKMSATLYALFSIESPLVGWPAQDSVTVVNLDSGKVTSIKYRAPANDGVVIKKGHNFVFTGQLYKKHGSVKTWAAVIDENGRLIRRGWNLVT